MKVWKQTCYNIILSSSRNASKLDARVTSTSRTNRNTRLISAVGASDAAAICGCTAECNTPLRCFRITWNAAEYSGEFVDAGNAHCIGRVRDIYSGSPRESSQIVNQAHQLYYRPRSVFFAFPMFFPLYTSNRFRCFLHLHLIHRCSLLVYEQVLN